MSDSPFVQAFVKGLEGLQAVSSGVCPGCETCRESLGYESLKALHKAWQTGETPDESHFSWSPCDVCGCRLGGDRHIWHAIPGQPGENLKGKEILHFEGMCTDCVLFYANGDEPEHWQPR